MDSIAFCNGFLALHLAFNAVVDDLVVIIVVNVAAIIAVLGGLFLPFPMMWQNAAFLIITCHWVIYAIDNTEVRIMKLPVCIILMELFFLSIASVHWNLGHFNGSAIAWW